MYLYLRTLAFLGFLHLIGQGVQAATYYSVGSGTFNQTTVWNTQPNGSGTAPTAADLAAGTHDFVVQTGHTITLADNRTVQSLSVAGTWLHGGGAPGPDTLTVQPGGLAIAAGGSYAVGSAAVHTLLLSGPLVNDGALSLYVSGAQAVRSVWQTGVSVGGTTTPTLYDVVVAGNAQTALSLDIRGSVSLINGSVFDGGNGLTHTVYGDWNEDNNSRLIGTNTVRFEGTFSTAINATAQAVEFHHLTIAKGGANRLALFQARVDVNGDLLVDNNSELRVQNLHYQRGDFSVTAGATYTVTTSVRTHFDRSGDQALTLAGTATFQEVRFEGSGSKTIAGNLEVNGLLRVNNGVGLTDDGGDHRLPRTDLNNGPVGFSGTVTLTGGELRNDGPSGILGFGAATVTVEGNCVLQDGRTWQVGGNLTIRQNRNLTLNETSALVATGSGQVFQMLNRGQLQLRGTDQFPTGFGTYDLRSDSRTYYNGNASLTQTVRGGISYGNLYLTNGQKVASGNLDINGNLDLNGPTADPAVRVNLGAFDHTLAGNLITNTGGGRTYRITSTGSFTFDAPDANQTLQASGGTNPSFYQFAQLSFTSTGTTQMRTKSLLAPVTIASSFAVTNTGGDEVSFVTFDPNDNIINGGFVATFQLGAHTLWRTSGANNFAAAAVTFSSMNLDAASTIRFDGGGVNQNIPAVVAFSAPLLYGNLEFQGNTTQKIPQGPLNVRGEVRYVNGDGTFVYGNFNHRVGGNWSVPVDRAVVTTGSTITFDGSGAQAINAAEFHHVTFAGTGTKTLVGALNILGQTTITTAPVVAQNNLDIWGNWVGDGTGSFTQSDNYFVTFRGNTVKTIRANASSYFGQIRIGTTIVSEMVPITLQTDVRVLGDMDLRQDRASLNLNGYTLRVGGNWFFRTGNTFAAASGTVRYDGDSQQDIRNYQPIDYHHVQFSGSGEKRLLDGPLTVNGDFEIVDGSVNGFGRRIAVRGNWINNGFFAHADSVIFDGANQVIGRSEFQHVRIGGTGTKTMGGNWQLGGGLRIAPGATLDISPAQYALILEGQWFNEGGTFVARQGQVNLTGGTSNLNSAGQAFYNLRINLGTSTDQLRLQDPLTVGNQMAIARGMFVTNVHNVTVGGDLLCDDRFNQTNDASILFLRGTAGGPTYTFRPTNDLFRNVVIDAATSTYQLDGALNLSNNRRLTLASGTLKLNGFAVTLNGNGGVRIEPAATLDVDAGATLRIGNDSLVNRGTLRLVGVAGNSASVLASTANNYVFYQAGGTLHARHYLVSGTRGNGLHFVGGTLDATDNLSDGSFASGTGNAYLTLTGQNFADFTANNVSFGPGPVHNVSRLSGSGVITFSDAGGSLAGEIYDQENPANEDPILSTSGLVQWTFPNGFFWDGGGDATTWTDALNWSGNTVPSADADVLLDHSQVPGAYTVAIITPVGTNRLRLAGAGVPITVALNGGTLTTANNLTVGAGDVLSQTAATDTIRVGGSWAMSGTYQPNGVGIVQFEATNGTHTVNSGGQPFVTLLVNADGATYVLADPMTILGQIALNNGTLDAGSHNILVTGNWTLGSGTFVPRNRTVTFDGAQPQTIGGGNFYDVDFTGSGAKTLTGNLAAGRHVRLLGGVTLDGGVQTVFVGGNWTNDAGASAFAQSGNGGVVLDGNNQTVGGTAATTFRNLAVQGTGIKTIAQALAVTGNVNLLTATATTRLDAAGSITAQGSDNVLTLNAGVLEIRGANNFPANFQEINLAGGTVRYQADTDQVIFATDYPRLELWRLTAGISPNPVKTAAGDFSVNTFIIQHPEVDLDAAGYTLTLQGSFIKNSLQPVIWNGGTLIHTGGDWTISDKLANFHHLILAGTGTKRLSAATQVTGDLRIENNVTFDMRTFATTGTNSGTLHVAPSATLRSSVLATEAAAFPTGFGNYQLDANSLTRLEGSAAQTLYTGVHYGRLTLATNGNVTFNDDVYVRGNLFTNNGTVLVNGGNHNLHLQGATVDIRQYPSPAGTVFFDGDDQNIYNNWNGSPKYLDYNHVVFGGTGTKTMTGNNDLVRTLGDVTIAPGVTVATNLPWEVRGAQWNNQGTFTHTGNTVTFDGSAAQTIQPGADHQFRALTFANGNKTIAGHGLVVGAGDFTIATGASVQMGNLSHRMACANFQINGSWTTSAASFEFDRTGGTQPLPALVAQNVTVRNGGAKLLTGAWQVYDLTIENATTLDVDNSQHYPIRVGGSWQNLGTFAGRLGTVAFESADTSPKTIRAGSAAAFNEVTFNQLTNETTTYTLEAPMGANRDVRIGAGATLQLNGQQLRVGTNNGVPQQLRIQPGATLWADAGSEVLMNTQNGNGLVDVEGTLRLVGSGLQAARMYCTTGSRLDVQVRAGGTIAAQFYLLQNLADGGLTLAPGASVSPMHNFSNGTWEGMRTGGTNTPSRRYLTANHTIPAGFPAVSNVTFRYGQAPNDSTFNVSRSAAASGQLVFAEPIAGELGGESYEQDPGDRVEWPAVSTVTWTGAISNDWFTAGNWSPAQVPTSDINAVIPSAINSALITGDNARCKQLRLTNGLLRLTGGFDLAVTEDVIVGDGGASILEVTSPASDISVGGNWSLNAASSFLNGGATVIFTASTGNVTLQTRPTSPFGSLIFNGGATFTLAGGDFPVTGSLTISAGTVVPPTGTNVLSVKGNFTNAGGTFAATAGIVRLDGADQTFSALGLFRAEMAGTGTKTAEGIVRVANACEVMDGVTLRAGNTGTLDFGGDVTIAVGATFHDGNRTHTFEGINWFGTGSYAGNGRIRFAREGGTQFIQAASFHHLELDGSSTKRLQGNVSLTGDLLLRTTSGNLFLETFAITHTGTGTFAVEAGRSVYVSGNNNFPAGFAAYDLDASSLTFYDGTSNQQVRGATYGNLTLVNANTKTLAGDIVVRGNLSFQTSRLDVSAQHYQITLAGDWFNNDPNGQFDARQGRVVLNGTQPQRIFNGNDVVATKEFYDLTLNKTDQTTFNNTYVRIRRHLIVEQGTLNSSGRTVRVGGDLIAQAGDFVGGGTYRLELPTGTAQVRTNGSALPALVIVGAATYNLQDNLDVTGDFSLANGATLAGNGYAVVLGTNLNTVNIGGTYQMGAGGQLALGANTTVTVTSSGTFEAVGTAADINLITRRATGAYNFVVDGTVRARHTQFEYTGAQGIRINGGGTIDPAQNFSFCTFTNGSSGGTYLRIENAQNLTGTQRIEGASFPFNPGGGASNVQKNQASGLVEFYNASGAFSGEAFDNDVNDLISWTGVVVRTWTGNQSNDWFNAQNWVASNATVSIPVVGEDVVIPSVLRQPVIGQAGAVANNLTIEPSAALTINTTDNAPGADLTIAAELTLDGALTATTGQDSLVIAGSWVRSATGSFTSGQGVVVFDVPGGSATLDNGAAPFHRLIKRGAGQLRLASQLVVRQELVIAAGSFDVTTSNFDVTVRGNFRNQATFDGRQGTLTLAPTTANTFDWQAGNGQYHQVQIAPTVSGATLRLTTAATVAQALNVSSGRLHLNGQSLTIAGGTLPTLTVSGTLTVNALATLRLANGATTTVTNGGRLELLGTSVTAQAVVTHNGSGRYGVVVNSGGTLAARHYRMAYLNAQGLRLLSGSTLDATHNLSDGVFTAGAAGGRYLLLEANLSANDTIREVTFEAGPTFNVRRTVLQQAVVFENATGARAGAIYEDDPNDQVFWTSNASTITWTNGAGDNYWNNPLNWNVSQVPTLSSEVILPTGSTVRLAKRPAQANPGGLAARLTIESGATLTIEDSLDLQVDGDLTVESGATLSVLANSVSELVVNGSWLNSGSFQAGASTVVLTASNGLVTLRSGGQAFCGLHLNSGNNATFATAGGLTVNCNFVLTRGTLAITDPTHLFTLNGNWQVSSAGNLTGPLTLILGGANQQLTQQSASPIARLNVVGTGVKTLLTNLTVSGNLSLQSTLDLNGRTLRLGGNWSNSGTLIATGTVAFVGTAVQRISASAGSQTFEHVVVNNTSGAPAAVVCEVPVFIVGQMTFTEGRVQTSVANPLTFRSGASTNADLTAASYVAGPVVKEGNQNFTFPIGSNDRFARIRISGLNTASTFRAQYFDTSYVALSPLASTLTSVSDNQYWNLERTSGLAQPFVGLFWEDSAFSKIKDVNSLVVAHWTGTEWENKGQNASLRTGTAAAGSIMSNFTFSNFSPITFGSESSANPLPVELLYFRAESEAERVWLRWATATELNNDRYTIERSADGRHFTAIGTVAGAGQSDQPLTYAWPDAQPLPGTSFYRLVQTDFDGTATYYEAVVVHRPTRMTAAQLRVFPTPARRGEVVQLALSGLSAYEPLYVVVINLHGQTVFAQRAEADAAGAWTLSLPALPASGVYMVTVRGRQATLTQRLIQR